MKLERVDVSNVVQNGLGEPGVFYLGDVLECLPTLLASYEGKAQTVYLDPPFATGKKFGVRLRVGEKDWRAASGSLQLTAYEDLREDAAYYDWMREVLEGARALLSDTGVLFLHVDYRTSAHFRLMLDELFGEENFLNEIIWTYQSGGRSVKHFSRKHDVIYFYRKTRKYYFDIKATGQPRGDKSSNHMKRHVDPDGRVYRSIRSGGKIYTYYEDDLVYPSDVWDDVSHLQQKDYQRTGFETQKPLKLLERIVGCSSKPGDLVVDLFAGSGTTLDAAQRCGRRFLGLDHGRIGMHLARRRLENGTVTYHAPPCEGNPQIEASAFVGVGFYHVELLSFTLEPGLVPMATPGLDAVDSWSVGYERKDAYEIFAAEGRSRETPALRTSLRLPVLTGTPMLQICDVLGRTFHYRFHREEMSL